MADTAPAELEITEHALWTDVQAFGKPLAQCFRWKGGQRVVLETQWFPDEDAARQFCSAVAVLARVLGGQGQ